MDAKNNPSLSTQTKSPTSVVWQAPEFVEHKKHPLWFVAFTLVIALVVLYGIYTKSWTMVVAFVLFGLMGLVFANKKPNQIEIVLNGQGVKISQTLIPFSNIQSFWIVYNPGLVKALYIQTKNYVNHTQRIELANQDPVEVKHFLQQYIEEDLDGQESMAEVIARKLKF